MVNHILRSYSMDFTTQIEHAQRTADGAWFRRYRDARYGYKWSRWTRTTAPEPERFLSETGKSARLPRD